MNNSATEATIRVENISLSIDNKVILEDISFSVNPKETLVLMGKNGSGKTVLLKTLVGLFKPQKGNSIILGKNVYQLGNRDWQNLFKNLGYVFQKSGLFDSMTVAENVFFALRRFSNRPLPELMQTATTCLNRTGLKDVEHKMPSELSGGMQKRAGIARAIAMNPQVLLLDDPTAGLDPVLTDAIGDLILEIQDSLQSSAIIITHDLNLAYKLADRIGLIINGRLHGILTTEEFKNSQSPAFEQFREGNLSGPIPVIE